MPRPPDRFSELLAWFPAHRVVAISSLNAAAIFILAGLLATAFLGGNNPVAEAEEEPALAPIARVRAEPSPAAIPRAPRAPAPEVERPRMGRREYEVQVRARKPKPRIERPQAPATADEFLPDELQPPPSEPQPPPYDPPPTLE